MPKYKWGEGSYYSRSVIFKQLNAGETVTKDLLGQLSPVRIYSRKFTLPRIRNSKEVVAYLYGNVEHRPQMKLDITGFKLKEEEHYITQRIGAKYIPDYNQLFNDEMLEKLILENGEFNYSY